MMLLLDWNIKDISLRPIKVLKRGEWYRIVTNAFFHEDLTHLGINIMGVWGLGRSLERLMGTKGFVNMTLWSIVLTSIVYLGTAMCIYTTLEYRNTTGIQHWYKKGTKGFSGVLFHWSVLSCFADRAALWELDFFEGIKIPAPYYPWASLLLWHMVDPDNEKGTLMHLAGLLVGLLHVEGYLSWILPKVLKSKKTVKNENEQEKQTTTDETSSREKKLQNKAKESVPVDATSVREARLKRFN